MQPMTQTRPAPNLDLFPIITYNPRNGNLHPTAPSTNLSTQLYLQLVYTLTGLLPPPLDSTPGALRARNHAAIAKIASMLPINANEADLAAQSIAARAQAEDIMRLLRANAHNVTLTIRLNAQYASMVRTSLSAHARLMRVQAVRQKRESIEDAANQDARTQHVAEQSMLKVIDRDTEQQQAAQPKPAPVAAPAPQEDQPTNKNVSETNTNSHDAAFETWISSQPWNQVPGTPDETGLSKRLHEAMAGSLQQLPANAHGSPTRTA
jgi:hypothetical protein